MIFEYTYMEWKESDFEWLAGLNPKNGAQVQDLLLHDTDESKLTERERLIMVLSAIAYEVDHNMLTEELRGELRLYYQDMKNGKLEGILGDNEEVELKADLEKYYIAVFGS